MKLLEPKAQFYDDVAGSKDSIEMSCLAKSPWNYRNGEKQYINELKVNGMN